MKKNIFISILALIVLSFVMVQCVKDSVYDKKENNIDQIESNNLNVLLQSNGLNLYNNNSEVASPLSGSCFDPPPNCNPTPIDDTITISFYYNGELICENLLFRVRCTVWACGGYDYVFDNFVVDPLSLSCAKLNDLLVNSSDDETARILDALDYQVSLAYEYRFISIIAITNNYICPNSAAEVHFYKNLCYQWCANIDKKARPGEPVLISMGKIVCGDKCCKRKRSYCVKDGVVQVSDPVFEEVGNGICGTTPITGCVNGRLYGDCERTCGAP